MRLAIVIAILALPSPGAAAPDNEECLACHDTIDKSKWEGSIHGEVSVQCVDCHADLAKAEIPHADKLAPAVCTPCHAKAVTAYGKGVHAAVKKGAKEPAATCASCHGAAHEIFASGDRRSRTHTLNIVATCARCHDDPKLIEAMNLPKDVVHDFQDSIHGRGLTEAGLVVAPTCATCHGPHDVRRSDDPASPVHELNQAATCGSCHVTIREKYEESIHAAKAKRGDQEAPFCATCHSAHKIQRSDAPSWELDVIRECGTCHEQSFTTYRDTFHGRVTELGYTRMAKCADCHNAHDIRARDDAGSTVNAANVVATCKKCHPGASPGFTRYDPHANPATPKRSVAVYYTAKLMKLLLFGVFGFFWLHTAMWLGRGMVDRMRKGSR